MDSSQQDAVDFLVNLINEIEKELGCINVSVSSHLRHKMNCFVALLQGRECFTHKFINSVDGSCPYCGTFPQKSENQFEIFHLYNNNSKSESIQDLLMENLQKPSEKFKFKCSGCKHGKSQDIHSYRSIKEGRVQKYIT